MHGRCRAGGASGGRGSALGSVYVPQDRATVEHFHLPESLELVQDGVADSIGDEILADLGDDIINDGDVDGGDVAARHDDGGRVPAARQRRRLGFRRPEGRRGFGGGGAGDAVERRRTRKMGN